MSLEILFVFHFHVTKLTLLTVGDLNFLVLGALPGPTVPPSPVIPQEVLREKSLPTLLTGPARLFRVETGEVRPVEPGAVLHHSPGTGVGQVAEEALPPRPLLRPAQHHRAGGVVSEEVVAQQGGGQEAQGTHPALVGTLGGRDHAGEGL